MKGGSTGLGTQVLVVLGRYCRELLLGPGLLPARPPLTPQPSWLAAGMLGAEQKM